MFYHYPAKELRLYFCWRPRCVYQLCQGWQNQSSNFIPQFRASDDLFYNLGNLRAQCSVQKHTLISYIIGQLPHLPQCYLQYKGWWPQPLQRGFFSRWNCQADGPSLHKRGTTGRRFGSGRTDCRLQGHVFFSLELYRSTQIFLHLVVYTYHIYIAHTSPSGIFKCVLEGFSKEEISTFHCAVFFCAAYSASAVGCALLSPCSEKL